MMRPPSSRRGMWMQAFMILFFVLILVVAIVLLGMEKKRLTTDRPLTAEDLADQRASATLISMLRRPVAFTDQGRIMSAPLADIIIMNFDGRYDKDIRAGVLTGVPKGWGAAVTIEYPSGKRLDIEAAPKPEDAALRTDAKNGPSTGTALLPGNAGNIKIAMRLS